MMVELYLKFSRDVIVQPIGRPLKTNVMKYSENNVSKRIGVVNTSNPFYVTLLYS